MPFARIAAVTFTAALALLLPARPLPVNALASQWLQNGGFEDSSAGWQVIGSTGSGCAPHEGSGALGLALGADGVLVTQEVTGSIPAGTYRLTGYVRTAGGQQASLKASVAWGSGPFAAAGEFAVTGNYTLFTQEFGNVSTVSNLRVRLTLTSTAATVVCLDNISLEGPFGDTTGQPPAGASPTATAPPTAATPAATSTAMALTVTATTPAATATPAVYRFVNGGFEDGIAGWKTFGGEASAVAEPKAGGAYSGRFSSQTSSTKWLYQAVVIDPALAYEFAGHLMTGSGVEEAYLRLSWYASADGSGQAINTDDSTSRVGPASGGFVYLTTGPKTPPAAARSVAVRIMLSPAGAMPAVIYADDFSLTASVPAAPASSPTSETVASQSGPVDSTPAPGDRSSPGPAPSRTPATRASSPTPRVGSPAATPPGFSQDAGEPPVPWPYLAIPAGAAALAAGYLYGRRGRT